MPAKNIFVICPVRGITEVERSAMTDYISELEGAGNRVHWPPRDTFQDNRVGLRICQDNRAAIGRATEIHVWWNEKSQGSLFDLGMAFALGKKFVLINFQDVPKTDGKSFQNVLLALSAKTAG